MSYQPQERIQQKREEILKAEKELADSDSKYPS